jgi:uncharacterized protein YcaQ
MPNPRSIHPPESRRILLAAQDLAAPPARRAGIAAVQTLIERLGFVQVDSINVLERAHHLILHTRLDGYKPATLQRLLEEDRTLFEHWTHDASIIPTKWYPQWKPRFTRYKARLGNDYAPMAKSMRARIKRRGPVRGRDLGANHPPQAKGGWWNWHPGKIALEQLWRAGVLAIARRERFEKWFDLVERVYPLPSAESAPKAREHVAWACSTALERLGVATPKELAEFWHSITTSDAKTWCATAIKTGEAEAIVLHDLDGAAREGVASTGATRLARQGVCDDRLRLICPFDPVIRDRARLERRFGFAYRFEAFVPKPKRIYGYYTLPLLRGDRFVGRVDLKFDRQAGVLIVRGPWWEPEMKTTVHRRLFKGALDRMTSFLGAEGWRILTP